MQGAPPVATGTAFPDVPIQHAPNHAHLLAVTDATTTVGAQDALGTVTQVVLPVVSRIAKEESQSHRPARADAARIAPGHADLVATILAEEDAAAVAPGAAAATVSVVVVRHVSADARHTVSQVARTHAQVDAITPTVSGPYQPDFNGIC